MFGKKQNWLRVDIASMTTSYLWKPYFEASKLTSTRFGERKLRCKVCIFINILALISCYAFSALSTSSAVDNFSAPWLPRKFWTCYMNSSGGDDPLGFGFVLNTSSNISSRISRPTKTPSLMLASLFWKINVFLKCWNASVFLPSHWSYPILHN